MPNMTYDAWVEKYRPIKNDLADNGYDQTLFETYGNELQFVKGAHGGDPSKVWTLREEDGVQAITPGFGFVNRLGFFVTEVAAGEDAPDEVLLDD